MSLIKWEPFDEFDRFFRDMPLIPAIRSGNVGFDMAVDLWEEGNTLIAEMNVPGLSADNIDVEVENNYLRIAGKREEMQEKKEKNHYAKEIRRGSFERVIQLPDAVDKAHVEAEYDNGVLTVRMPKQTSRSNDRVKVTVKK